MKHPKYALIAVSTLAVLLLGTIPVSAQQPPQTPPDNTKVNKRDRNPGEITADQQKETASDREVSSKIRKALTSDKSLSTYAHNIKVVSHNGTVTLKGPVHSDEEMKSIMDKATAIAGDNKVVNEMTVKTKDR
jgi:osmotically-inducible protein OsmY